MKKTVVLSAVLLAFGTNAALADQCGTAPIPPQLKGHWADEAAAKEDIKLIKAYQGKLADFRKCLDTMEKSDELTAEMQADIVARHDGTVTDEERVICHYLNEKMRFEGKPASDFQKCDEIK